MINKKKYIKNILLLLRHNGAALVQVQGSGHEVARESFRPRPDAHAVLVVREIGVAVAPVVNVDHVPVHRRHDFELGGNPCYDLLVQIHVLATPSFDVNSEVFEDFIKIKS